jgi:acyl-CoA synthetase (NDP forming)
VDNAALTFVETLVTPPSAPALAVVSQSGAMAAVLCTTMLARAVPVSYSVSTGNEAASGVEHYIDWLVNDPHTQVVAMIVEQFRAPAAFLAAARAIHAAGKRIVLLHPGKSSAARESAATHTGAMAGDYALMRAKVERAGVIFAETLEELGDISEILLRSPALTAREVAVLGESGAFKALTLDLAEELGLPLAALHDEDSPALRAALPVFVPVSNPLDITAQGLSQPVIYTNTLNALLSDDRIGAVVAGIIQGDPVTANQGARHPARAGRRDQAGDLRGPRRRRRDPRAVYRRSARRRGDLFPQHRACLAGPHPHRPGRHARSGRPYADAFRHPRAGG